MKYIKNAYFLQNPNMSKFLINRRVIDAGRKLNVYALLQQEQIIRLNYCKLKR